MSQFYTQPPGGSPAIPTSFATDSGTATPAGNVITFHGVGGTFSGSGSTVTFTVQDFQTGYRNIVGPATYNVLTTDYYISCDPTAGPITLKLPNSPTLYQYFVVKDRTGQSNNNNISVTTVGGVILIDGSATFVMNTPYNSAEFLWNGTSHEIF